MKNAFSTERKTGKVFLSLIVAVFAMMLMLTVGITSSAENVASGTCGDNLTWTLDDEGMLIIDGEGDMWDFYFDDDVPWFPYTTDIKYVSISDETTSIGDYAFSYCSGLTSIAIPENVTRIGHAAFIYCDGITEIQISANVTDIGQYAFSGCAKIERMTVDSDNTRYDSRNDCNAIINCYNSLLFGCKNTVIPSDVIRIDYGAFADITTLTSINIPESVTSIGNEAFLGCTGLTEINIPNSVKIIEESVFYGCTGLTEVTIPNNVKSIGGYAFDKCNNLTKITIPSKVKSMEEEVVPKETVIYGYTGSYAEQWADENERAFVAIISDCTHDNTELCDKADATCTTDGYTGDTCCLDCEQIIAYGKESEKLGHDFTGKVVSNHDGTHSYECKNGCGECGGTVSCIPDEWIIYDEPTCLKYGYKERYCSVCHFIYERESIMPKGHADENSDGFCDRCGRGGTELSNDISYETYWLAYKNPYKDDPDHIYDGLLYNKNDNTINLYLTDRDMPYIKYHPDTNTLDPKSAYITELYESGFYDEDEIEYWISEELTFWEGYINPPMPECDWLTVYDINDKTKDFCTCLDWTYDGTDIMEESVSVQAFISENENCIYLSETYADDVYRFLIKFGSSLYTECMNLFTAPSGHDFTGAMVSNHDGTHSFECVNGCGQTGASVSCSYGAWKTVTASTCTVSGTEERVCVCTAKETRELPLAEHKDGDNDGFCDDCGKELSDGSGENKQRKFPPCQNIISNFCDVYNEYADIPVLNVIFYIIHFFIHLAR